MIGTFGNIVFETSREKVLTFDGFQRSGSAEFAEHAVLDDKSRLQFTGQGLDEVSFSVRLDLAMGVDPGEQIRMARDIKSAGTAQTLMLGDNYMGDFVLTQLEERYVWIDGSGRLIVAELSLSLREFV